MNLFGFGIREFQVSEASEGVYGVVSMLQMVFVKILGVAVRLGLSLSLKNTRRFQRKFLNSQGFRRASVDGCYLHCPTSFFWHDLFSASITVAEILGLARSLSKQCEVRAIGIHDSQICIGFGIRGFQVFEGCYGVVSMLQVVFVKIPIVTVRIGLSLPLKNTCRFPKKCLNSEELVRMATIYIAQHLFLGMIFSELLFL